jgi:hypothetical protein
MMKIPSLVSRRKWRKRKFTSSNLSRYLIPGYFLLLTVILYILIYTGVERNSLMLLLLFTLYLVSGVTLGSKRKLKKRREARGEEGAQRARKRGSRRK